jgi:hypothetical protein
MAAPVDRAYRQSVRQSFLHRPHWWDMLYAAVSVPVVCMGCWLFAVLMLTSTPAQLDV